MGFGETNNSLSSRQRGEELERGTWFQIVDGGFGRTELTTDLDGGGVWTERCMGSLLDGCACTCLLVGIC